MRRAKRFKAVPAFQSEEDERTFWETHDTTEYVDWSQARVGVFPDLRPSTETISLRLPAGLLAELKIFANKRDVPYQSLMKIFLAERVARERAINAGPASDKALPRTRQKRRAPEPER
ncbi:MAG: BrnA antitoxin family protein [Bryobacteraceae bacterium]|nr:BrnA antitoxin family protein [Bryobacteraceae bacterium]